MPLLLCALGFARFTAGQKVLAGVSVAGVDVAGHTPKQVELRLAERARSLAQRQLDVQLGDRRSRIGAGELGIALAVEESAAKALAVGRNAGVFRNLARYARSFWFEERLAAALRVDAARLEAALDVLEGALISDPPFAGGLSVAGGNVEALPPRPGRRIAREGARLALREALALGGAAPVVLSAATVTPELAPGSLERVVERATRALRGSVVLEHEGKRLEIAPGELAPLIAARFNAGELEVGLDAARVEAWLEPRRAGVEEPARDASFAVSPQDEVSVVPGEPGLRLVASDVTDALWAAAQRDDRRGALPLEREPQPARSTEQAERLGITRLVGSFTTRYPCCQPRVNNIHRVAALLDGLVVEPGQTVSVNAVVGPRTQKNGFVPAPSIEDGEMVDTVGGGVSQFATTFFNAIFHAGYDIIERQPHTYWFPRYPMGHEATLSWPKPDIVFKNDSDAGLLIKTSVTKTSVTVKLYGDTQGRKVTSDVSERRDIVKPPVELLPNRDVPPDEEKVKESGSVGWSVIASRTVTFADGTKKEERRKVTYRPKPRRVEVHPCRIPDGEPGATGEPCPEPPDVEQLASEPEAPPAQAG